MANIVKVDKFLGITKKTNAAKFSTSSKKGTSGNQNLLLNIEKKVIKIDKLLKDSLLLQKTQNEKKRVATEQKTFANEEKELEKKKPKESQLKGGIALPSPPKIGIFGWIKNFIGNLFLGFIAVRLIDHLPQLIKTLPIIMKAGEAIIDFAGSILNGLVTFVDWGYKAVDATRGFIKTIGGDNTVKLFDNFGGAINKLIDVAIIAAIVAADMGGGGPGGSGGGGGLRVGGKGAGRVDSRVARRYAERFGRDAALKKFGKEGVENLGGKYARSSASNVARKAFVGLAGKGGAKTVLGVVRPLLKRLPIIGALIDFGLSVALGEDPGRAAFKAIGAGLLGSVGAAVGSLAFGFGGIVGGILGSIGGDAIGGALYDMFFGSKKPTAKGKTTKAATGGPITSGGKSKVGSGKRTITKKTKRTIKIQPTKIKPGASVGGEEKIAKVFPESKDKSKINPLGYMKKSYDTLSSSPGFGGVFGLALKAQLGEKPSDLDYKIAASGLSSWMESNLGAGGAFAEGGSVDVGMFGNGKDMTNMIAKSLEESISSKVDTAINDLMKQLGLKEGEKKSDDKKSGPDGGEGEFEVGPAGTSGDKLTMARNLMRDLGLTADQAAGIVGNMAAESGVENARVQDTPPGTKGTLKVDGKTGYGIVQWTSQGRQQALADYAKSKGADLNKPLSMDIEYQFFLKEFKGKYGHVLSQIKQAPDVKTASTIFMQQYEVPAGYKTEAKIMERYNMSKPIYDKLAKGEGKATEGPGTYIDSPTNIGKSNAVQYITGDVNYKGDGRQFYYDLADHGLPSNYHDHIAFATIADKEVAKKKLRAAGIEIGSEYKGRERSPGYHGKNLAFDVPGGQWRGSGAIGQKEFAGSRKVRQILGIGAYLKGGRVLKPTLTTLAEKGQEFVLDYDTTINSPPGFLEALNKANTKQGVMYLIQKYASYNQPYGGEPQIVEVPVPMPMPSGGGGGMIPIPMGGGVNNNDQFDFDRLAIG